MHPVRSYMHWNLRIFLLKINFVQEKKMPRKIGEMSWIYQNWQLNRALFSQLLILQLNWAKFFWFKFLNKKLIICKYLWSWLGLPGLTGPQGEIGLTGLPGIGIPGESGSNGYPGWVVWVLSFVFQLRRLMTSLI